MQMTKVRVSLNSGFTSTGFFVILQTYFRQLFHASWKVRDLERALISTYVHAWDWIEYDGAFLCNYGVLTGADTACTSGCSFCDNYPYWSIFKLSQMIKLPYARSCEPNVEWKVRFCELKSIEEPQICLRWAICIQIICVGQEKSAKTAWWSKDKSRAKWIAMWSRMSYIRTTLWVTMRNPNAYCATICMTLLRNTEQT